MSNPTETFWSAVKTGDAAQVQSLLAADPALAQARTPEGVSAVLLAVYYGHAPVGELILAARGPADPYEAAALGHTTRLAELLDAAPDQLNAFAADGFTLLGLAAYFGHPAAVHLLLARGAAVNLAARNAMQVRPLHSAVANRDAATAYALAEALLRHGAEPNAQQQGGYTPLHETAFHGELALTRLLLAHGADPRVPTTEGLTALDLADKHGHAEVAALLRAA